MELAASLVEIRVARTYINSEMLTIKNETGKKLLRSMFVSLKANVDCLCVHVHRCTCDCVCLSKWAFVSAVKLLS